MSTVLILGALPQSLLNFRGALIRSLYTRGYDVNVMAGNSNVDDELVKKLAMYNAALHTYHVERNRSGVLCDIKTYFNLRSKFESLEPEVILAYTIKPVIWGGIASRVLSNVRFYALITGLGYAFQGGSIKREILRKLIVHLYRLSLKNAKAVIFQNPDNLKTFVDLRIVSLSKCVLVNGSGVDVDYFCRKELPSSGFQFLAIGRLLSEKGFREYFAAAAIVKKRFPKSNFQLLGPTDTSPDAIPLAEVQEWEDKSIVEYLGAVDDVRPYIEACHVLVLPSYHEGMPRTVLEAMSMGRPILTTDVPGCRETVIEGENGFLVQKANVEELAERMIWFIENQHKCSDMGERSREIAEDKFDVRKVNKKIIETMGL